MMNAKCFLLILIVFPMQALAEKNQIVDGGHTFFYGVSLSDAKYLGNKNGQDTDEGIVNEFGYRYTINDILSIDTRYMKSNSIGFKQIASLGVIDESISYSALTASIQAHFKITDNSYIYGNVGGANYDWNYSKEGPWTSKIDKREISDSGVGVISAIGLRYQWSKFELYLERKWLAMGDVKSQKFGVGIGYTF